MQSFLAALLTQRRWWLLCTLVVVTLLAVLFLLRSCQAQPGSRQQVTPAPAAAAPPVLVLTWTYTPAAPERFVVRRSIEGGTWQDVGVRPGASGTGLTWEDTTLPASAAPQTVKYVVYAVAAGNAWSEASNVAVTVVGEEQPLPLGECVAVKRGKKKVLITCTQE